MNRKKTSKVNREISEEEKRVIALSKDRAKATRVHPYDDLNSWLMDDFKTPPWSPQQIQDFQDQLDSAFEVKNGIVLAWSGDRRYGDVFLNEKGDIERKPPLLFAEVPIEGTNDYLYISAPRWLLLETIHGSQLEAGWEEASVVQDGTGVKTRIRPEKPPEYMYQHFKIIAEHEETIVLGDIPPCCVRMGNRVCYGNYREPSEKDIALVRRTRENMNKAGVVQRNDEARTRKVLMDGQIATQHFIKRAREQQAMRVKEILLSNTETFFGDIPAKLGSTKSVKELEHIFKKALDQQDEERFATA